MTPTTKGLKLGGEHINKALNDPNFFVVLPEFMPVKAAMDKAKADMSRRGGCSTCKKRRARAAVDGAFMSVATNLSDDKARILKAYLGIPDTVRLVIQGYDRAANRVVLKTY